MEIVGKKHKGTDIVQLSGRLDLNTAPEFETAIFDRIDSGSKNMVVELENLDYISSAGLKILLKLAQVLKGIEGGKLVLCGIKDHVKKVFEIVGFNTFMDITPNLEDALNQFR